MATILQKTVLLLNGVPAAAAASTLILDNFTDTDAVALTAHTIAPTNTPATSWTDIKVLTTSAAAANAIISNQARCTVANTGAVVDAGVADCTITVDWTPQAGSNRGIVIFRYNTDGNMFYVWMNEVGGAFNLYEVATDTPTLRGTVAQTFTELQTYEIKVTLSGTSIEVFLDSVSKITYTSAIYQTETQHGIGMNTGISGRFDDFTIDP